jgi:DNA-binding MarR family transcriptional regulator
MSKDFIDDLQKDWNEERPDLDSEPMGVVLRVQALAKIFNERASDRLEQFDLHWWQYDVLSALRRQGKPYSMAATELADAGMLTSGAMTNRIDRLEAAGLVQRNKDTLDRRRVLVQLTDVGLSMIENATEARFDSATDSISQLDDKQRHTLNKLLRLVLMSQEERASDTGVKIRS